MEINNNLMNGKKYNLVHNKNKEYTLLHEDF
jgi:hypothetical protein